MNVLFVILGVISVVAGIVLLCVNAHRKSEYDGAPIGGKAGSRALIIAGALIFIAGFSFTIIPTGYTGVKSTFGQIDSSTMQAGFNWKVPFAQTIATVNNKQQDIKFSEDKIWSETSSRTAIYYEGITVTYQISPDKSAWIYANVSDYENNMVSQSLVSSGIKSASKTLSDTDATNRSIVEPLVLKYVQGSLDEKYGEGVVTVNKVVITNADFDESYTNAVAAKQAAQLAAEKQAIENEKNVAAAEAEAKVKRTQAQAEADALKIKSEAEAEANKKISSSLNANILQEKYIEKWNGNLPDTMAGDSATMLIPNSKSE